MTGKGGSCGMKLVEKKSSEIVKRNQGYSSTYYYTRAVMTVIGHGGIRYAAFGNCEMDLKDLRGTPLFAWISQRTCV